MNGAAGTFARFIHKYITSKLWSSASGDVWIVDNSLKQLKHIDMNAVNELMTKHSKDKFIIVNTPTYEQVL
jgi:ABC-type transport system involved in cytochrome c biogenesis ATPase subunit